MVCCGCPPQCRDALTTRQKLIAQDYKVSYSLAKACKTDLRKYRCSADTNMPRAREARLSYLLLCLESAVHRGGAGSCLPNLYLCVHLFDLLCFVNVQYQSKVWTHHVCFFTTFYIVE